MLSSPLDLAGRTILVTGASSGIGRATAVLLSQLGSRVILSGQNAERLEQTRAALATENPHFVERLDLSQTERIVPWMKELVSRTGPLHGVVHSAGLHSLSPLQALSPAKLDTLLRVNVSGAIFLVKGLRQGGCAAPGASAVLVSSVAGLTGQPALGAYSASKAALLGFARSAAAELAPAGIRVNCVAPGLVETEMTAHLRQQLSDEQFLAIQKAHPLGLGTPADVAHSIAFLLAPASRWITGTTLIVDGGYSAV